MFIFGVNLELKFQKNFYRKYTEDIVKDIERIYLKKCLFSE